MKSISIYFSITLVWLIIFELVSLFFLKKMGTPFDQAIFLLEANQKIGWTQKKNLETTFLNTSFITNSKGFRSTEKIPQKNDILIYGPSSAIGWGVEKHHSFADIIEKKSGRIVHNFSQIGFTTWQGLKLLNKNIGNINSNLIIIAYGINDFDKFRFYYNSIKEDKVEFIKSKKKNINDTIRFLNSSSLLRMILKLKEYTEMNYSCNYFLKQYNQRVSETDSIDNIKKMVQIAQTKNTKVLILTTSYLPLNQTNIQIKTLGIQKKRITELRRVFNKKSYSELINNFKNVIKKSPFLAEEYYLKSYAAAKVGKCKQAKHFFKEALENEKYNISLKVDRFNKALEKLSSDDIQILNIEKIIKNKKNYKDFFYDPVHFSKAGNKLIADEIVKLLNSSNTKLHGH